MSIEDKIREIAKEKFEGFSYVFEDWNGAVEVVDRVDLPAIICILPIGGYLDMTRGKVRIARTSSLLSLTRYSVTLMEMTMSRCTPR